MVGAKCVIQSSFHFKDYKHFCQYTCTYAGNSNRQPVHSTPAKFKVAHYKEMYIYELIGKQDVDEHILTTNSRIHLKLMHD